MINKTFFPIRRITPLTDSWIPEEFWQIVDQPREIFVQGTDTALQLLKKLPSNGLAVVGTREPQLKSLQMVSRIIDQLKVTDLAILSGFARGIDTAAHRAALKNHLATVAVVGSGLDINYPSENSELREQILSQDGLLISEFPLGTAAHRGNFIQRNRLIAGWAKATWVVEADLRSGALNTAKWARRQNKNCFATPCFPGERSLRGNQVLLDRDHAEPVWGAHSFSSAWFELYDLGMRLPDVLSRAKTPLTEPSPTALKGKTTGLNRLEELVGQVALFTREEGGVLVPKLLEWALEKGWLPEHLFSLLRQALEQGDIQKTQGRFSSIENLNIH